jgi:molybdenum cofactor cytidylyltransferase
MLDVVPRLVIVLGAHAGKIRPAIPRDGRIEIVENQNYSRGQLSSLKVGLGAVRSDCEGAIVHLADHPMVDVKSFKAIVDSYDRTRKPIVIARSSGRRGHPVLFDRTVFVELLSAPEDEGARYVVNADASRVEYVELDDPGINLDLDTPADLAGAGLAAPPEWLK